MRQDSASLVEIERQLLQKPLDMELRRRYADLLMTEQAWGEALVQFQLLMEANAEQAYYIIGVARCQLFLGNREQALQLYAQAKALDAFASDPELQAAMKEAEVTERPHLHVVKGIPDNLVRFPRNEELKTSFDDIAGMDELKKVLRMQIIEPFRNPGLFARFRKKSGGGVLLYGPPGCGKTLMARAIAAECNASFMSVGLTDVLSLWLGESERNLVQLFEKARQAKPALLFFDELDALAFSRSKAHSEQSRQVVTELLAQLDGFAQENEGVMILAATNMPWDVDPAIKRPGRFSRQVFVPPPDAQARAAMFASKLKDVPHGIIDNEVLASMSEYCSGADIDGIIDMAKEYVLSDIIGGITERVLRQDDLQRACEQAVPSTFDWLRTAHNLVRYGGTDRSYKDVEAYLKAAKFKAKAPRE